MINWLMFCYSIFLGQFNGAIEQRHGQLIQ